MGFVIPMGMKMERCWGSFGEIGVAFGVVERELELLFASLDEGLEGRCVGDGRRDRDGL